MVMCRLFRVGVVPFNEKSPPPLHMVHKYVIYFFMEYQGTSSTAGTWDHTRMQFGTAVVIIPGTWSLIPGTIPGTW